MVIMIMLRCFIEIMRKDADGLGLVENVVVHHLHHNSSAAMCGVDAAPRPIDEAELRRLHRSGPHHHEARAR